MTPIVIRAARGRLILLLLGSLVFVACGILMIVVDPGPKNIAIGLLSIVLFGMCGALFLRQLLDARPRLVIDDEGIFDRTLKVGRIEWGDILGAEVRTISGASFISLRLKNLEKHTSQLSPIHRRLTEANRALGFEALNLNLAALDIDPHVLTELILKEAELRRHARTGEEAAYRAPS